jgi:hypothetical protein
LCGAEAAAAGATAAEVAGGTCGVLPQAASNSEPNAMREERRENIKR